MRIALVEDNSDFREEVQFHLQRFGHEIFIAAESTGLDQLLRVHPIDLVVLDLGLPGEDGLSIATRLRRTRPEIRLLMLTARAGLDHRIKGLEVGADAYLAKPVDMRELKAVIDNIHRRMSRQAADGGSVWTVQPLTLSIRSPAGDTVALTSTEIVLVRLLAEVAPNIVSRNQLAAALGYTDPNYDFRRLEATISRLRRKIEGSIAKQSVIRPARGRGYIFAAPVRVE